MVSEQAAAQQIESCVSKGERESVARHHPVSIAQMGGNAIEQSDLQVKSTMLQPLAHRLRNVS